MCKMYVSMCVCVQVCACGCSCSQRPEGGIRFPGVELQLVVSHPDPNALRISIKLSTETYPGPLESWKFRKISKTFALLLLLNGVFCCWRQCLTTSQKAFGLSYHF